jgi:hypothetical protein
MAASRAMGPGADGQHVQVVGVQALPSDEVFGPLARFLQIKTTAMSARD